MFFHPKSHILDAKFDIFLCEKENNNNHFNNEENHTNFVNVVSYMCGKSA